MTFALNLLTFYFTQIASLHLVSEKMMSPFYAKFYAETISGVLVTGANIGGSPGKLIFFSRFYHKSLIYQIFIECLLYDNIMF